MPSTLTTGSANISQLDSNILSSLCAGAFIIDVKSSVFIGDGATNVLGAKVEILNELGIPVKEFGSAYDIEPPMSSEVIVDIPTQAGNFQMGRYKITVRLFDGSSSWDVVKYVKVCYPNSSDKSKKYGVIGAKIKGNCKGNPAYVHFLLNNVPSYNGFLSSSQVNTLSLEYPTGSEKLPEDISATNFKALLFEGQYKISGDVCATYDYGDGVKAEVLYKLKAEKIIRCGLDMACIFSKLIELNSQLSSNCSAEQKNNLSNVTLDVLLLITTIEAAVEVGEDPSSYIDELEALLGCKCTCNCDPATPYNGSGEPTGNVVVAGCGVQESEDGLTKTYTINHRNYIIAVTPNDNVLVASAIDESVECTRKQTLTFDIAVAYTKIKALANVDNTEANFWASIINKTLNSIDASCFGYTPQIWSSFTLAQKFAAVMAKICSCCGCDGEVTTLNLEPNGSSVMVFPFFTDDVIRWKVYVDGVFLAELDISVTNYEAIGAGDGNTHTIKVVPICANGKDGVEKSKEITAYGCPEIGVVNMANNQTHQVDCPFDLNSLIGDVPAPPAGTTVEWHSADDTSQNTVIQDPTNVGSGAYWAFNKDANGCYSQGKKTIIVCNVNTSCTAPQNLQFIPADGGGGVIRFSAAAYPPPGNSYTVMRRLASDPDEYASYTWIGVPEYNLSINKWQIKDETGLVGVLYVYRVMSSCTEFFEQNPFVELTVANVLCPVAEYTVGSEEISASFVNVGGDVDKYVVELWDSTKNTLLHEIEFTTPFANPIVATFDNTYIVPSTVYHIRIKLFIAEWQKVCDFAQVMSEPDAGVNNGQFAIGFPFSDLCSTVPITLYYTDAVPGPGTVLYTDPSLAWAVDGDYTRVLIVDTGIIYFLNFGLIGAATGDVC